MKTEISSVYIDDIECFSPAVAESYAGFSKDWFEVTKQLSENSFWVSARTELLLYLVNKYAPGCHPVKFFELGCATGDFVGQLANQPRFECIGSEIYLQGLAFAKEKFPAVKFIQLDATAPEIPYKEHFDLVGAFDVLEHIENDTCAITNINKLLKKDGKFIVLVPQYKFMWSKLDELVSHKRRYSKKEMFTKLRDDGFEIEFSSSFVFALFPFMLASRMFAKIFDRRTESDEDALKRNVEFPKWVNAIFSAISKLDIYLIRLGIALPFGGTLVVVARKR